MRTTREKIIRSSLFFSILTLVFLAYADTVLAQNTSAAITIGFLDLFKNPGMFLGWVGAEILLRVAGLFTWIGGVILNTSLNISVLDMSKIVSGTSSINTAWGTLRDLANIVFIFLLLAIGIGTILRLPGYGIKQLLAQVLIVAVLINFSLFFTKLIIDVPNRLAVEFYNGLSISYCTDTQNPGTCTKAGLSDRFMNAMKISTLFDVRSIQNKFGTEAAAATLSGGNIFLIGIFGSVFLLIAGFIFFAAGILLAIRFAVLIILMVLSPLAFVFMVIPYTKKYASDWWSKLFSNAFFAPAYLLLTWISLKIIEDQNFFYQGKNSSSDSFAAAFTQGGDALPIVFNFMVVSVFMVASLVVASKMGAYGSGAMIKMGHSMRKWGQGMLGRPIVGGLSYLTGKGYDRVEARLKSTPGGRTAAKLLNIATLGMGGVVNRAARQTIESGTKATFGSGESFASNREYDKKRGAILAAKQREISDEKKIKNVQAALAAGTTPSPADDLTKISTKTLEEIGKARFNELVDVATELSLDQFENILKSTEFTDAEKDNLRQSRFKAIHTARDTGTVADVEKALRGVSDKEIEMFDSSLLVDGKIIEALSAAQHDAIQKSSKINSKNKALARENRQNHFQNLIAKAATGATADLDSTLSKMTAVQIANLNSIKTTAGDSILTDENVIKNLRPSILEEISKVAPMKVRKSVRDEIEKLASNPTTPPSSPIHDSHAWLVMNPAGQLF